MGTLNSNYDNTNYNTQQQQQPMFNDQSIAQINQYETSVPYSTRGGRNQTDLQMQSAPNKNRFGHARNSSVSGIGSKSLLSNTGKNIMNNDGGNLPPLMEKRIEVKSNFLRRGQGRGGSPTEFDLMYAPAKDTKSLSPNSKYIAQ